MTAPTPSPEEPRIVVRPQYVRLGAVLIALETSKSLREALRAVHDLKTEQFDNASLIAPLREEVERLRAEATAHMGVARAAEAEVARLREALRPFAEDAAYFEACNAPDESSIHAWVVGRMPPRPRKDVTVGHLRAAARALAEGSEDPSQKL